MWDFFKSPVNICFKNVKAEAVKKTKAPAKVEKAVTVADPPQNVRGKPEPLPQMQVC